MSITYFTLTDSVIINTGYYSFELPYKEFRLYNVNNYTIIDNQFPKNTKLINNKSLNYLFYKNCKNSNQDEESRYKNNLELDYDLEVNFNQEISNKYLSCMDRITFKSVNEIYFKIKNYIYDYYNNLY